MRRMKTETKRKIAGAVAILIILSMVLSMILPLIANAEEINGFTIEGTVGIGGFYRINASTPVEAFITNNGADFTGEAEIKFNISGNDINSEYIVYSYPLELPQGTSKRISMNIQIPTIIKGLTVDLVNNNKKTVASRGLGVSAIRSSSTLFGVLTDDEKSLSFLKQMKFYDEETGENQALAERVVFLDEKSIPSDIETLQNFNFLLINHFDTRRLSSAQINVLKSFVSAGGILVIGTGVHAEQTLACITDVLSVSIDGMTKISRAWDASYLNETSFESVDFANLSIDDSVLYTDEIMYGEGNIGEIPISFHGAYGNGNIIIHSFDLGESAIFEQYGMIEMINEAYVNTYNTSMQKNSIYTNSQYYNNNYWGMANILGNLPNLSSNSIFVIFVVIGIYLIFIGPILYILLKKKNKRDYAWFIIPGASVVVTLFIVVLSLGTEYKKPLLNTISIVDLAAGTGIGKANINLAAYSPDNGTISTQFDNSLTLSVNLSNLNMYGRTSSNMNDSTFCRIRYGEKPEIVFYDQMSWSGNIFTTEKNITFSGGITANLTLKQNKLIGTVTNGTEIDFTDVIISHSGIITNIGEIPAFGTKDVSVDVLQNVGNSYYSYVMAEQAFPYHLNQNGVDIFINDTFSGEELRMYELKRYFFQMELDNEMSTANNFTYAYASASTVGMKSSYSYDSYAIDLTQAKIYAISAEPLISHSVTINNKIPTETQLTMVKTKTSINLDENGIELAFGTVPIVEIITDVSFDRYANYQSVNTYSDGEMIVVYEIPEGFDADWFIFNMNYNNLHIKSVDSDTWEPLKLTQYSPEGYVDENGQIEVRFNVNQNQYYELPSISMSISKKKGGV